MKNNIAWFIFFVLCILAMCGYPDWIHICYSDTYNRSNWPHWVDEDHDGFNTREEVLLRDNVGDVVFNGNRGITVVSGTWICPYTGKVFHKVGDIDIDHIVPLGNAYRSGGSTWSKEQRRVFANDMDNLLSVEDNANQEKGDKGPEFWKPAIKGYWKQYATSWIKIKDKYNLSYTKEEAEALEFMLNGSIR